MEKTLIMIKPDAINRSLVGEVLHRFERKGFKIVGMKMTMLKDKELEEHYAHLKDQPFFGRLVEFMKKTPTLLMVLEGGNVVDVCRKLAGPTYGVEAPAGTIRGDFSLSRQNTIIHASENKELAEKEIKMFFKPAEIFEYDKIDFEMIYSEEERE